MMVIMIGVTLYFIKVFICISLIFSKIDHLFMCLLSIWISSLKKCLFRSSAHFLIGMFVFFWFWAVWAIYIFWRPIPVSYFISNCFQPFWRLSFNLVYSFFSFAKAFKINKVQFVYFCFHLHYYRRWVRKDLAAIYVKECTTHVFL